VDARVGSARAKRRHTLPHQVEQRPLQHALHRPQFHSLVTRNDRRSENPRPRANLRTPRRLRNRPRLELLLPAVEVRPVVRDMKAVSRHSGGSEKRRERKRPNTASREIRSLSLTAPAPERPGNHPPRHLDAAACDSARVSPKSMICAPGLEHAAQRGRMVLRGGRDARSTLTSNASKRGGTVLPLRILARPRRLGRLAHGDEPGGGFIAGLLFPRGPFASAPSTGAHASGDVALRHTPAAVRAPSPNETPAR